MIDPINLPFVEYHGERIVDRARAVQIPADRFLDNQPGERPVAGRLLPCDEPPALQLLHGCAEQRRRNCQVVDPIAGQISFVLDRVEPRSQFRQTVRVIDRRADEEQCGRERLPHRFIDRAARKLGDPVFREFAIFVVAQLGSADADNRDPRWQQAVEVKVVERRQQFAMRKVAGAAKYDDRHRIGLRCPTVAGRQLFDQRRRGHACFTAWPPN